MSNWTVILLDVALAAALWFLGVMARLRHLPSGPEGPVGAWLLLVPPLFLMGGVLAKLASAGVFDWMPGGRVTGWAVAAGAGVASMVTMWFLMAPGDGMWGRAAALAPWLMVAGGFAAVHGGLQPPPVFKAAVGGLLGTGAVAGWALVMWGGGLWIQNENRKSQAALDRDRAWQQSRVEEFHALGEHAELWKYFGYLYLDDEVERERCRALVAARPDLDAKLLQYLSIPTLEAPAVHYIAEVYAQPPAALAPEFGRYLERSLAAWRPVLDGTESPYDRRRELEPMFRAAARLEAAGGDLAAPLRQWRDYLRTMKGLGDLADQIEVTLRAHKK